MMRLETGYEQRGTRIEIVPLIDVVFLLLVFFIYAMLSMTVFRGLQVTLPRAGGDAETRELVVLVIGPDNTIWLDEQPVTLAQAATLAAARTAPGGRPVLISGDRSADLGVSIELLAALRRAGVEQVSFQVAEP